MEDLNYTDFYRRHLPHFQPPEAQFFITARLAGTLPASALEQMKEEYERVVRALPPTGPLGERLRRYGDTRMAYFKRFDGLLDGSSTGPAWLKDERVARIVSDAVHFLDGKRYDLLCSCIMSNHIHLIIDTTGFGEAVPRQDDRLLSLTQIMASLKSYTAHESNKLLHRSGQFWQRESYDHVIRDGDELERMIRYVLNNPVKAGLVSYWKEWPWTYCREGLLL
jgi:putative transposase